MEASSCNTEAQALLTSTGWLKIHTDAASLASRRRLAKRQAEYGVESRTLSVAETQSLEPALADGLAGAIFYPEVMSLRSPQRAIESLARRFTSDGSAFTQDEVTAIGQSGTAAWIETAGAGRQIFDYIVIACGAWSAPFAAMVGERLCLKAERGYHVMLYHPPLPLTRPVTVSSPGYTIAPMQDGLRIASGVEFASLSAPPDLRRIQAMARHATTIVDGLDPAPKAEWLGFRPSMPNSIPVLRRARRNHRIVLAFGHGHLGVTLGPHEAGRIAALIEAPATSVV